MNNQMGHMTDDDLRITREHLEASKQVIDHLADPAKLRVILHDVLDLSIGLIDEQRRGLAEDVANPTSATRQHNGDGSREMLAALVRIAEIAEGHWLQLSKNDRVLADGKYRHHVMSKLGNALREYRMLSQVQTTSHSTGPEQAVNGADRTAPLQGSGATETARRT
ncbi:MAG: hypothetical protein JWQ98_2284 [Chlorobi bacterium]|jgi:hypothetical protein|nr:hypothetical protein [Chlorobiota bacterium]